MFVQVKAYGLATEDHAFHFKAEPLIESRFGGQQDASSSADDTMPGNEGAAILQRPHDLARSSGKSGRGGDAAVSGYASAWDSPDDGADLSQHLRAL